MSAKLKPQDILEADRQAMRSWKDTEFEELRLFLGINMTRDQLLGGAKEQLDIKRKPELASRKPSTKSNAERRR